jgi:pimeloyl-ACP methyl ester carboxylesterase
MGGRTLELRQGRVRCRDQGAGPVLVFVHGLFVNGDVWRDVVPALVERYRCVVPDLPLGGHRVPMAADADLSLPGLAGLVDELLAALDLRDVTLVGNDTGGAICQLVVARHPQRLARLVLTNCDAFEDFFPASLRPLQRAARLPGFASLLGLVLRSKLARRKLFARLAWRCLDSRVARSYFTPIARSAGVRRDVTRVLRGIDNRYTLEAARSFSAFGKPVLVAWGDDDLIFPQGCAERLALAFPDARLERISRSRTLVPEDRPGELARLLTAFVPAEGVD